jgi:AraC-like DNA-binding protein
MESLWALMQEVFQQSTLDSELLQNLLHAFLLSAEKSLPVGKLQKEKNSEKLNQLLLFRKYIEESYTKMRRVKEYCKNRGLSEKQLSRLVRQLTDKSPKQLMDERLILEAKRLLSHSGMSVKEISFSLGFEEPTNFNKYFKKHEKITPLQFRSKFQ